MANLVTIEQAKVWFGLEGTTHEDENIQSCVDTAELICLNYVRQRVNGDEDGWQTTVDAWTEQTAPVHVKKAIEVMASRLWRFRGDDADGPKMDFGYLPMEVTWLLYRFKDPAMA